MTIKGERGSTGQERKRGKERSDNTEKKPEMKGSEMECKEKWAEKKRN